MGTLIAMGFRLCGSRSRTRGSARAARVSGPRTAVLRRHHRTHTGGGRR